MKFRTKETAIRIKKEFLKPSKTEQHHKERCDVNKIVSKYVRTGIIDHIKDRSGIYGDISGVEDFRGCLQKVQNVTNHFMSLPAEIRDKFSNNPAKFLDYLKDPKNYDEIVELGLAVPRPINEPKKEETKT